MTTMSVSKATTCDFNSTINTTNIIVGNQGIMEIHPFFIFLLSLALLAWQYS